MPELRRCEGCCHCCRQGATGGHEPGIFKRAASEPHGLAAAGMGTGTDGYVRPVWVTLRRQQAQIDALREEASILRECLENAGVFQLDKFQVRLHRKRFESIRRVHPITAPLAQLSHMLGVRELAEIAGLAAGPTASRRLQLADRATRKALDEVIPAVDRCAPVGMYICGGYDGVKSLSCVEQLDLEAGEWRHITPMARPRGRAASAVVAGKLIVAGGNDGASYLSCAESYDPATGSWEALPPMSSARARATAVALGDRFYICGGFDDERFLSSAERYCPAAGRWESLPQMLARREGAATIAMQGQLLICGGFSGQKYLRQCETFVPNASVRGKSAVGQWKSAPMLWEGRRCPMLSLVSETVYLCGGHDGARDLGSVERLARGASQWEVLRPMHVKRRRGVAVACGRYVYVFGGQEGIRCTTSAERFDPETATWEMLPPMAEPRRGAMACSVKGKIYIAGGVGSNGSFYRSVECFDTSLRMWRPAASMCSRRASSVVACIQA